MGKNQVLKYLCLFGYKYVLIKYSKTKIRSEIFIHGTGQVFSEIKIIECLTDNILIW